MEIKELNYIVTIADEGSISRAAEKLYMAQSSLSQFLQVYEAELGTPIFMRTSRGVRPTAAGATFIAHARQILLHYRKAQNEVWDIEDLKGGRVEFGIATFRGTYLLPPVLKKFHERYPAIHVEITEQDSISLEEMIQEGLLDLALVALPAVYLKENVEPLMTDEILLVTTKDHPVMKYVHPAADSSGRPWIHLADTAEFEYILGPKETILGRAAREEFQKLGLKPFTRNTNFTAPFAAAMAREGIALAFTYESCMVKSEDAAYLRIGEKGIFLELGLAYSPGEYRSKAASTLGALFHEMYGNFPVDFST